MKQVLQRCLLLIHPVALRSNWNAVHDLSKLCTGLDALADSICGTTIVVEKCTILVDFQSLEFLVDFSKIFKTIEKYQLYQTFEMIADIRYFSLRLVRSFETVQELSVHVVKFGHFEENGAEIALRDHWLRRVQCGFYCLHVLVT
jgi:hypothetical protein